MCVRPVLGRARQEPGPAAKPVPMLVGEPFAGTTPVSYGVRKGTGSVLRAFFSYTVLCYCLSCTLHLGLGGVFFHF